MKDLLFEHLFTLAGCIYSARNNSIVIDNFGENCSTSQ